MCSAKKDQLELYALKALNHPQSARRSSVVDGTAFARFTGDDKTEHLMRQTRVTVGRSSARSVADVDMGDSTFISRNHLEIYLDQSKFFVLVTGKNGIFVNDEFHKKGSPPVELPPLCQLRFPSTDIRLQFEALPSSETSNATSQADCHELVIEEDVSQLQEDDEIVAEEDSQSVLDSYTEEATSDVQEPFAVASEVVPISVETEEVCVPVVHKEREATPVISTKSHFGSTGPVMSVVRGSRDEAKPPYSYAQLIVQAIMSTVDKQLTLSGIYAYITRNYPYYKATDKGWQNSIRHNLSLNRYFIKVARSQEESGKGSFWRVDPSSEALLVDQAFRRRRQRGSSVGNAMPSSYIQSTSHTELMSSSGMCTPEDSLSVDNQEIEEQPTIYVSDISSVPPPAKTQRLHDFNWASPVGQAQVIQGKETPHNVYTYTVQQPTAADTNVVQFQTSKQVHPVARSQTVTLPPITVLQNPAPESNRISAASSLNTSTAAIFRYITSLSQRQAVLIPRSAVVGIPPTTIDSANGNIVSLTGKSINMTTFSNGTSAQPSAPRGFTGTTVLVEQNNESGNGISDVGLCITDIDHKRSADTLLDSGDVPRTRLEYVSPGTIVNQ